MSDAQLPPIDPDEVEGDEMTSRDAAASGEPSDAAVAGEGPALLTPPVPETSPDPVDGEPTDEDEGD